MILSGREILKHIGNEIVIEPFDKRRINPNSYNLSLFNELLVYENNILDMRQPNRTSKIVIPDNGLGVLYVLLMRFTKNSGLSIMLNFL